MLEPIDDLEGLKPLPWIGVYLNKLSGWLWFYLVLSVVLVCGTGLYSDDFLIVLTLSRSRGVISLLNFFTYSPSHPLSHYTHGIFYHFCSLDSYWPVVMMKVFYVMCCILMVERFFSLYLSSSRSATCAFMFIFFPSHEAVVYWFGPQFYITAVALLLFSYYLLEHKRYCLAGVFAFAGAFTGYASPPVIAALILLCVLNRRYLQSLIFLVPGGMYSVYYVVSSYWMSRGVERIPKNFDLLALARQFVLQALTFTDAALGPSFALKIYYSILAATWIYAIIGVAAVSFYCFLLRKDGVEPRNGLDAKLTITLVALTLITFGIYAVTGMFPNMAFNLGNRTTTNGSLLLVYLLVAYPIPKKIYHTIVVILLAAIVGLAAHWHTWTNHQNTVLGQMRTAISEAGEIDRTIFVKGNQYSRLGSFNHIEFLSEHWVADSAVKLAGDPRLSAMSLNRNLRYDNGFIVDIKYGKQYPHTGDFLIYDSDTAGFIEMPPDKINEYIATLPPNTRHWVQLLGDGAISSIVIKLMPRLKYIFDN